MIDKWEQILKALENSKYKWRTLNGISKETGLDVQIVKDQIDRHSDTIIKSSIPSEDGEDLYTTRSHYRNKSSFLEKIKISIINRPST